MEEFRPEGTELSQILSLIDQSRSPSSEVQRNLRAHLESLEANDRFNSYLTYVFSQLTSEDVMRRVMSGILLKNNVRRHFSRFQPSTRNLVAECTARALRDPTSLIRSTASSIISEYVKADNYTCLPVLSSSLLNDLMESGDENACKGALTAFRCIVEDATSTYTIPLSITELAFEKSVRIVADNDNQSVQEAALLLIRNLTELNVLKSPTLVPLLVRVGEKESLRFLSLKILSNLLEINDPDILSADNMRHLLPVVFKYTQGEAQDPVVLECFEFWLRLGSAPNIKELLSQEMLNELVPAILTKMRYQPDDPNLAVTNNDEDRDEDLKPFVPKALGDDQVDDENVAVEAGEDDPSCWNTRKCAAATLDQLSAVFGSMLFEALLPPVQSMLTAQNDWLQREAGILALGAVSRGCIDAIFPHLPGLVPFLMNSLRDPNPPVKSITCWTLGRYASWIVNEGAELSLFDQFLTIILELMLDSNKKVQQASLTALNSVLDECAAHLLSPYFSHILNTFKRALEVYARANTILLYDTFCQFCATLHSEIKHPATVHSIIEPLLSRWKNINDRRLLPLIECITSIVISIQAAFEPYADDVVQRSTALLNSFVDAEEEEDCDDFLTVILSLLSAIAEALQQRNGSFAQTLHKSKFIAPLLVPKLLRHSSIDCRQSSLALLGDIAKFNAYSLLKEHLKEVASACLDNFRVRSNVPVTNNAIWSLGEILKQIILCQDGEGAVELAEPIAKDIDFIVHAFCDGDERFSRHVFDNTAMTICTIGFLYPNIVHKHLDTLIDPITKSLTRIVDDNTKNVAVKGLIKVVHFQAASVRKHFKNLCTVVFSSRNREPLTILVHALLELQNAPELRFIASEIQLLPSEHKSQLEFLLTAANQQRS